MSDVDALFRVYQRLADNEQLTIRVGADSTAPTDIIVHAGLGERLRALLMDDLARQITAAGLPATGAE